MDHSQFLHHRGRSCKQIFIFPKFFIFLVILIIMSPIYLIILIILTLPKLVFVFQ